MAQQIGLYVHRLRVFDNNRRRELGSGNGCFDLRRLINGFVDHHTREHFESIDRSSTLQLELADEELICGFIKYGSNGVISDIVDAETGDVLHERTAKDLEVIPLYFGFFTPEEDDTWYVASQSYGTRSCSGSFLQALSRYFRNRSNKTLIIQKVMALDEQAFNRSRVRKVTLVRSKVPSKEARQQIGDVARELKMELSISVDGRGYLGYFDEIRDRIADRGDRALVFDGIEFEQIEATVRLGNSYRKVGVLGVSNTAGVIDISDYIERDGRGYATFESAHREAVDIVQDYQRQLRDQ